MEAALGALADGRVALDELAGLARGSLDVGGGATATTYLLPPLLGEFHTRHPAIRLFVREQGSAAVVEGVRAGALDLGVVTAPVLRQVPDAARLSVEPWVEDELRLIVPPGHALGEQEGFQWSDLHGMPMVLFEAGSAVRELIDGLLEARGIEVINVMELRSIESMKQMVAQGIGVSLISRFALTDDAPGLPCLEGAVTRLLALITHRDRSLGAAARAFRKLLREAGTT